MGSTKTIAAIKNICVYCGGESIEPVYCCAGCRTLHQLMQHPTLSLSLSPENSFSHLDQPDFKALYQQSTSARDFVFYAKGMHCSSCVHILEKLPQFCDSVVASRVDYGKSTVSVRLSDGGSLAAVANAIKALGYEPSLLAPEEKGVRREKDERRESLKRIAVAGFCAGNTMLFVIPVYAGLAGGLKDVFNWLSFLLFLPVLLYSAQPFYRGAWTSLVYRVMNVDLPIAVALTAGFIFSTLNLIRGSGAIYFDSTASFLFLILCARHVLKSLQKQQLSAPSIKTTLNLEKYLRLNADGTRQAVPFAKVAPGDVLVISAGQSIPTDGRLISKTALIDMSLLNGESLPKHFTQNMVVFGGTKNLQHEIHVVVQSTFEDSKIGALCSQLDSGVGAKNEFTTLTDKLAQKLILIVFAIAVLFFVAYAQVDSSEAFNRALALIVVACPCALAFGAPLTYGFALKRALELGIFVKDSNAFEKLLSLKNVFFDKTGTLTEGQLKLTHTEPANLPEHLKRVALSLEANSYHPIAFALREAWQGVSDLYQVVDSKEILGYGICGVIHNTQYEIRSLAESTHEAEVAVEILEAGKSVAILYFADRLRVDSAAVVHTLQTRGMDCFILSGDRKDRCQTIGAACEIPADHIHGELFPEDKAKIVHSKGDTCMLGDGANDTLSLQAANVGIAVKGSVDLSLAHSDIYFTRGGLRPLLQLLEISQKTRSVLRRNLTISLVYNITGGSLALAGYINPMLAAVLMPISSVAIILSSVYGFRGDAE